MNKIYLGVDIGGTSIKYGLVSEDGVILKKNSFLVDNNLDQYSIIEKLSNELNLFIKENNLEHYMIEGVGIGCPGSINSEKGVCDYSNNLKWNDLPVKQIIENNCKINCKNPRKSAKNNKILKKTLAKTASHWYNCRRVAA